MIRELYIEKTDESINAFAVYPDSERFDLADMNTLMAVFRTEEQANIFGKIMWNTTYYVKPIYSPHFT